MRLSFVLHLAAALGAAAAPLTTTTTTTTTTRLLHPRWTGTTRRTSQVTVVNHTKSAITCVSLAHKYSSVYKDGKEWARIDPGAAAQDWMKVSYNTGPFTTGRDWWLLTFYDDRGTTLYATAPNNFRAVVDALESVAGTLVLAASGAAAGAGVAFAGLTGVGGFLAPLAAIGIAKLTSDRLLSAEPTDGLKQHTLRVEDEGRLTAVIVNEDYTVTFRSASGDVSETVTAAVAVAKGKRTGRP
ncbi:hypothetical protein L249_0076 [Ophiocordyceps polyrhachis-furcata BCC 54312]|uniref:Up-regulated in Daf-2 domain-containing protein n=1 Tax=Ophiocordyceps polyrhachis-furcata BCC 54312 TaxID=1330021 RepID=A0A367LF50_9HYPO|nr:hypothetical protein L249_0076 [Ophiocordyceps polyrhachis-furcata BCC 54312]